MAREKCLERLASGAVASVLSPETPLEAPKLRAFALAADWVRRLWRWFRFESPAYPAADWNAPARISFEVTVEDIRAGMPRNERSCPVAHAVRRTVGRDDFEVVANPDSVAVGPTIGTPCWYISDEVSQWIEAYDENPLLAKPIKATLEWRASFPLQYPVG